MSINDRLWRITKSYINSTIDSLEDGFEDFSERVKTREIGEEFLKKLKSSKPSSDSSLSDEEIERILKEEVFNTKQKQQQNSRKRTSRKEKNKLEEAYKKLGVSPQMTLKEIKKVYKKEILKYHPDHFGDDPQKQATATKVSQTLTEAFQTIKKVHKDSQR